MGFYICYSNYSCVFELQFTPYIYIIYVSRRGCISFVNKIVKKLPLHKARDPISFSNFRPVFLLPLFSKALERLLIMYNRLLFSICLNMLFYTYQFGFLCNHSSELAPLCLVDKISNSIEHGDSVLLLFLDYCQAFDTVNHDILFTKLQYLGHRGIPLLWFKSYLSIRKQYVVCNYMSSSHIIISCGVPQGFTLGLLSVLLCISDIACVSNVLFPLVFADELFIQMNTKIYKGNSHHDIQKISVHN